MRTGFRDRYPADEDYVVCFCELSPLVLLAVAELGEPVLDDADRGRGASPTGWAMMNCCPSGETS